MAGHFNVPYWNIRVDVVYYRDGNDRIGYDGDDDQGEDDPRGPGHFPGGGTRKVKIQHKKPKGEKPTAGDEQIELLLESGDAYDMDGECDYEACLSMSKLRALLTNAHNPFSFLCTQAKCKKPMSTASRRTSRLSAIQRVTVSH
jgi:hypothetical protein